MNTSPMSRAALLGICAIALIWIGFTTLFELHLAWPTNSIEWGKRGMGWLVEGCLFYTLARGVQKYHSTSSKR